MSGGRNERHKAWLLVLSTLLFAIMSIVVLLPHTSLAVSAKDCTLESWTKPNAPKLSDREQECADAGFCTVIRESFHSTRKFDCTAAFNAVKQEDADKETTNKAMSKYINILCTGNAKAFECGKEVGNAFTVCKAQKSTHEEAVCMRSHMLNLYNLQGHSEEDIISALETGAQVSQDATSDATTTENNDQGIKNECDAGDTTGDGWGYANPDCSPAGSDTPETASTCRIDGVGWLVCPVANFMAKAADSFYNIISSWLEIKSSYLFSTTNKDKDGKDESNVAYTAYRNFLPLANILLAIIFVLIIYSEATGNGFGALSNYSVKKLLPRLVVFAVLINISWYLCAAAVDLSNIIGVNMKGFFDRTSDDISRDVRNTGGFWENASNGKNTSWSTATAAILVGAKFFASGTGTVALKHAAVTGFSILAPLLVIALVVLAIVFLVLIIRQAGVVILSLISPIAIAMGMLPNTKKLFDKWMSSFFALLIVWPAVAVAVGASDIASAIMDRTSSDLLNSGNLLTGGVMALAAVATRVIPLIAIPFIALSCLKAFGKISVTIDNMARRGIKRTGRWGLNRSGGAAKASATRQMMQNARHWNNPRGRTKLGRNLSKYTTGLGGMAIQGIIQKSYDNKKKNEASKQLVDNLLHTNREKEIENNPNGRIAQVRSNLDRATLRAETAKAFSNMNKQKQIVQDKNMTAQNNTHLAWNAATERYQIKQNDNYVDALQAEHGTGTLTDIATGNVPQPTSTVGQRFANRFSGGANARQATAGASSASGDSGSAPDVGTASNGAGAIPPGTGTLGQAMSPAAALGMALSSQKKNADSDKSKRQAYFRKTYKTPTDLVAAIKGGTMTTVEVEAAVELLNDTGKSGSYTTANGAVQSYRDLMEDSGTMQRYGSTITKSAIKSDDLKKQNTALYLGARDYNKPVSQGGYGGTGTITTKESIRRHMDEFRRTTTGKDAGNWNSDMWESGQSIDDDTTMDFSRFADMALSSNGSGMSKEVKKAAKDVQQNGTNLIIKHSTDNDWMLDRNNIQRVADSSLIKRQEPSLAQAAKNKIETNKHGAVTKQNRLDAAVYEYNDIYSGIDNNRRAGFSRTEQLLHGQATRWRARNHQTIEDKRNISIDVSKVADDDKAAAEQHNDMIADELHNQVESEGVTSYNASLLSASEPIRRHDWSLYGVAADMAAASTATGYRRTITPTQLHDARKQSAIRRLDKIRDRFHKRPDIVNNWSPDEVRIMADTVKEAKDRGIDKGLYDDFAKVGARKTSATATYSDMHDKSAWQYFASKVI